MIRAVIFDFDHTLYDRDASLAKMLTPFKEATAAYINHALSDDELVKRMREADRAGVYVRGWQTVYEEYIKRDIFSTVPDYTEYMKHIRTHQPRSIVLFEDTLPTLTRLREMGLAVGMLTNGAHVSQTDKLQNTPVVPYFDKILIGGDLPAQKPHAVAFEATCEALGVLPSEALFVGDNPVADIEGAKNAGLTAAWMPYVKPYPAGVTPPDYIIDKLGDIPTLVEKLNQR